MGGILRVWAFSRHRLVVFNSLAETEWAPKSLVHELHHLQRFTEVSWRGELSRKQVSHFLAARRTCFRRALAFLRTFSLDDADFLCTESLDALSAAVHDELQTAHTQRTAAILEELRNPPDEGDWREHAFGGMQRTLKALHAMTQSSPQNQTAKSIAGLDAFGGVGDHNLGTTEQLKSNRGREPWQCRAEAEDCLAECCGMLCVMDQLRELVPSPVATRRRKVDNTGLEATDSGSDRNSSDFQPRIQHSYIA